MINEDGAVRGVVALDLKTGAVEVIRAKAVIMAAGGAGRIFEPSTNALICTGDGLALAYRAGAPLMDMEMVQFHPTTLARTGILLSEAARGEGAYLLNKDGDRFMKTYAPDYMELASRDVVSRAEQTEIDEGRGIEGNVLLDLRHLGIPSTSPSRSSPPATSFGSPRRSNRPAGAWPVPPSARRSPGSGCGVHGD